LALPLGDNQSALDASARRKTAYPPVMVNVMKVNAIAAQRVADAEAKRAKARRDGGKKLQQKRAKTAPRAGA
jgi:hypothetical protein